MRRPYDLMSMMKQERRSRGLNQLKKELMDRKEEIDKNEDKDTGSMLLLGWLILYADFFKISLSCSVITVTD